MIPANTPPVKSRAPPKVMDKPIAFAARVVKKAVPKTVPITVIIGGIFRFSPSFWQTLLKTTKTTPVIIPITGLSEVIQAVKV